VTAILSVVLHPGWVIGSGRWPGRVGLLLNASGDRAGFKFRLSG
jgi:hypothetical protein